jgi:hypothetical protein
MSDEHGGLDNVSQSVLYGLAASQTRIMSLGLVLLHFASKSD